GRGAPYARPFGGGTGSPMMRLPRTASTAFTTMTGRSPKTPPSTSVSSAAPAGAQARPVPDGWFVLLMLVLLSCRRPSSGRRVFGISAEEDTVAPGVWETLPGRPVAYIPGTDQGQEDRSSVEFGEQGGAGERRQGELGELRPRLRDAAAVLA